ncbi:MAG: mandelate racemase/muconate lactonizing enzyme family protein [Chloroflexi bacterium]|nr:mandelate racemase/muconate lactonizing enzyme family protein [Chloroflexota bacterium]
MDTLETHADKNRNRVKITAIKALQLRNHGQSLVKVETDTGVFGLGEAGAPGPIVRAHINDYFAPRLIGQDPLNIEYLWQIMTHGVSQWQARYVHLPTVSGIDIALWDLAGKLLNRSVSELLTGRFRDEVPLYVNVTSHPENWLDPASCKEWAQRETAHPDGFRTLKMGFDDLLAAGPRKGWHQGGRPSLMLSQSELRLIRQGYENCRAALGWDKDLIIHCHNEWDLPSAIGIAETVAPAKPLWVEDALPVMYSEAWKAYKLASPVRVMTGEKLELLSEFLPFLTNSAVDVLHPDLAYAGGITGCRKVADLAELYYVPVVTHNVGSLVQLLATAHFGACARNFVMSENRIPQGDLFEAMNEYPLIVKEGKLLLPDESGLGIKLVPEVIRDNLRDGEPYWD